MKIVYMNDTGREVSIHPATLSHGCKTDDESVILPLTERTFYLPEGTYAWIKMWDYGAVGGLQLLISPRIDD